MNVFDSLSKDSIIFGNHFLEASAGTGKTFAIEHVFVRLILESPEDDEITVDKILVVTFTKAATRDLKQRIRQNLERALLFFKGETNSSIPFDYLSPFLESKKKAIKKIQQALFLFDEAQIFTIHGFCLFMLNQYAFESDSMSDLSEDITSSYKEKIKNQAFDYLRYFLDRSEYLPEQIAIILKNDQDISTLIDRIINFLPKKEKSFSAKKLLEKINEFFLDNSLLNKELNFSNIEFSSFRKKIFEDFDKAKAFYKKSGYPSDQELNNQLDLLLKIFENRFCSLEQFNQLLKNKLTLLKFLSFSNLKKRSGAFSSKDLNYPDFFDLCTQKILPIVEEGCNEELIFNNLAIDIQQLAKKKMMEEDLLSFDDILIKMDKSLDVFEFNHKVKSHYKAAIIDEFQDTDPLQWNIFKKIFFQNNEYIKAFYLVGDPKQSIYAFRNADLKTYFSAAELLGKEAKYFLNTNYRSSESLIRSINFLFSEEFINRWLKAGKNEISSYLPVLSKIKVDDLFQDEKPVVFFITKDKSIKTKKWPSKVIENFFFYPFILEEISRLTKIKKLKYQDIAILVKDRYEAENIKKFLLNHSVPSNSRSHLLITETMAFEALKEVLSATLDCLDINKIKIALSGPYIRWTDSDILQRKMDNYVQLFCNLNNILNKKGLFHFFRSFLHSGWHEDGESVYEKLLNKSDLSFYKNTIQLIEILSQKDREEKLHSNNLLKIFDKLKREENQNLTSSSFPSQDAVEILTVHMSKGLEFEVVFALGASARVVVKDDLEEANLEKLRQLYVAFTRAKKKLYVPIIIDENENGYDDSSLSLVEVLFKHSLKNLEILDGEFIEKKLDFLEKKDIISCKFLNLKKENLFFEKQEERPLELKAPSMPEIKNDFGLIYSFSSLSSKKPEFFSMKERQSEETILSSTLFAPGVEIGVVFHRILEKIFKEAQKTFNDQVTIEEIVKEEVEKSSFLGKEEKILKVISLAMNAQISDKNFSLKDISPENIFVESEFLFSLAEEKNLMKGFIDLVFFHDEKYYILDWKSNWLGDKYEDYSEENLKKAMDEHDYFLQAQIYAGALKRFLKNIDPRPFDSIFGGAIYLFLRGLKEDSPKSGIYHFIPSSFLSKL